MFKELKALKAPPPDPRVLKEREARMAALRREEAEKKARWLEAASQRIADPDWESFEWSEIFDQDDKCDGASEEDLRLLQASLSRPLSEDEIRLINETRVDAVDPESWKLPDAPLPQSYLRFLRWSNGGEFVRGDRQISPFFQASWVREYLVGYAIPQYMPGAVPIGFDGGGNFYLLDMRSPAVGGEYPILFSHGGSLGYGDDSLLVATSFYALCLGTTNPSEIH